ncbi:MAG: hypothetical protein ABSD31_14555 [Candidatus Binataceae bacterium]
MAVAGIALGAEKNCFTEEDSFSTNDEVANRPWNAANVDALRALGKSGVSEPDTENDIDEFAWMDLAGDGKYELLTTQLGKGRAYLFISWQGAPGKLRAQTYDGAGRGLDQMLRDLDGDGKRELILDSRIDGDDRPVMPGLGEFPAAWPQVCRLRNGRYVDASRDFAKFYDSEVLPELEREINKVARRAAARQGKPKPTPGPNEIQEQVDVQWYGPERSLALLEMERDKILRVLGRDSNAGQAEAREWMKSSDPELVEDAVVVLSDIGGQEQDLKAAKSTLIRLQPWQAEVLGDGQ